MARGIALKDAWREYQLFRNRVIVAGTIAVLLLLVLSARMFYLQVLGHNHFTTLSHNNRVSIVPIAPTRGLVYDRNGVMLADNVPTFSLEIVPEQTSDIEATLQSISALIEISDSDLERFRTHLRRKRRFEEIPLRFRLTEDEVARISVNRHRLPGVEIKSRLSRYYPLGERMAHVVGYVGRINEAELRRLDASNYSSTTHIGKVGIEKTYEKLLHGRVGFQQVETNAQGRVLRVLERTPPQPGRGLYLNVDVRLHAEAEEAFQGERGALVAVEPTTGAVLALVSTPSFDPNMFVNGIDHKSYRELSTSNDRPLFNRALRGQYPPGSTTKPFIGLAGLESGKVRASDRTFCPGFYTLEGDERRYRDWKRSGHGHVSLNRAIVESCDVYFYDLSLNLGIDVLSDFMHKFGFGVRTGIDLVGEASGLMPTREWKRRVHHQPWFPGETLITGIGQGFMLATPLQLAANTGALGLGGSRYKPRVVGFIEDPATGELEATAPETLETVPTVEHRNWKRITDAMTQVIHGYRGTARGISRELPYQIAGKTGTAQVFGIAQGEEYVAEDIVKRLRDHALFVAYAPADNPHIAIAVVVENGGGGGAVAAPIARRVLDRYLLNNTELAEAIESDA